MKKLFNLKKTASYGAIACCFIASFYFNSDKDFGRDLHLLGLINSAIAQSEDGTIMAAYMQEGTGTTTLTYIENGKTCVESYDWDRTICSGVGQVSCTPSEVVSNRKKTCS